MDHEARNDREASLANLEHPLGEVQRERTAERTKAPPVPTGSFDDLPPTIPSPPSSRSLCPEWTIPPSSPRVSDRLRREAGLDPQREAMARAPIDAASRFALALLEVEREAHDAAEAALKKAIYLAPDVAEAHYRLGLLRLQRGDVNSARRSFSCARSALDASRDQAPPWAASLDLCLAELEWRE